MNPFPNSCSCRFYSTVARDIDCEAEVDRGVIEPIRWKKMEGEAKLSEFIAFIYLFIFLFSFSCYTIEISMLLELLFSICSYDLEVGIKNFGIINCYKFVKTLETDLRDKFWMFYHWMRLNDSEREGENLHFNSRSDDLTTAVYVVYDVPS